MLDRRQLNWLWVLGGTGACCFLSCGRAPQQSVQPQAEWIKAPAPPGASITASKMCRCNACEPSACCGGSDFMQEEPNCDPATAICGIEIKSCVGRCDDVVWRVPRDQACDSRMPESCCDAG